MISNPPTLEELKSLGWRNWKEHRPKLFKALQRSGELQESLNLAAEKTLDDYHRVKNQLLQKGYEPNQAHETAWELVREEWLLKPSEEQPELETR